MASERVKILDPAAETAEAQAIAARYRCEYVDLRVASIDHDLFRSIPVDLMFRYNFVPMRAQDGGGTLAILLRAGDNDAHDQSKNPGPAYCRRARPASAPIVIASLRGPAMLV